MSRTSEKLKGDSLGRSLCLTLGVAVLCHVIAVGRGLFLARWLSPAELGVWALMSHAVQVLAFFLLLGIPSGISRYTDRRVREGSVRTFLLQTCGGALALAAICCLAGLAFWRPLGHALYAERSSFALVALTLVALLSIVAFSILQGVLHGLRLFRLNAWLELIQNAGFLIMAGLLMVVWRADVFAAGWAQLLITFAATAAIGLIVIRAIAGRATATESTSSGPSSSGHWRVLLVYSLGLWSAGTLQAVWHGLDRYMLLHLGGLSTHETLEQIGGYFLVTRLCQPLGALAGLASVILLPHVARLWENRQATEVVRIVNLSAKLSMVLMTLLGAMLIVSHRFLLTLLVGRIPPDASSILPLVIVTIIALSLHCIIRTYLQCREQVWLFTGVWLISLVANAALNVCLIPRWNLYGAVLATMISAVIALIAVIILSVHNGLRLEPGTRALFASPIVLFLPPPAMLLALTVLACYILQSNLLFTVKEKEHMNRWIRERLVVLPVRFWARVCKFGSVSS